MHMVGKKVIYSSIGLVATAIAILGVWLPGIPTTLPLLVALWAFGKSSKRLYTFLTKLPLLKTALREARRYEKEHTVTRETKVISQASAWLSFIIVALVTQNLPISLVVAFAATTCSIFMYRIPTHAAEQHSSSK